MLAGWLEGPLTGYTTAASSNRWRINFCGTTARFYPSSTGLPQLYTPVLAVTAGFQEILTTDDCADYYWGVAGGQQTNLAVSVRQNGGVFVTAAVMTHENRRNWPRTTRCESLTRERHFDERVQKLGRIDPYVPAHLFPFYPRHCQMDKSEGKKKSVH